MVFEYGSCRLYVSGHGVWLQECKGNVLEAPVDDMGSTPLIWAILHERYTHARALVVAGANFTLRLESLPHPELLSGLKKGSVYNNNRSTQVDTPRQVAGYTHTGHQPPVSACATCTAFHHTD